MQSLKKIHAWAQMQDPLLKGTSVCIFVLPDQSPRFVASDLVLHCLLMSHEKDARLIWANQY